MDLSKLSDEDLQALKNKDLTKVSDAGLAALKEGSATEMATAQEPDVAHKLLGYGGSALQGLAKLSDSLRAATVGPLTGEIYSKLGNNKPTYSYGEGLTKPGLFPSNDEMRAKAGLAPGKPLSDIIPGYSSKGSPWYLPEKGGHLDPTVDRIVQTVTDPAMWTGLGETALAAKGLSMPAQAVGAVNKIVNPLSMMTSKIGKGAYEGPLLPLEQQGARKGKEKVAQVLYEGGVKTPFSLPQKAQGVIDDLMTQRDAILKKAEEAGGRASMEDAVGPLRSKIAQIRLSQDPAQQAIADKMESRINEYLNIEKGIPAIPEQVSKVSSPLLDPSGQPFTKEVVTPGSPAIPGKAVTPLEASGYKTSIYKTQPKMAYDTAGKSDFETELDSLLAKGQLQASQNAVEKSLGPEAAQKVEDLNRKVGNLLSTQRAQQTVTERAQRQLHQLKEISPYDMGIGALGASMGGSNGAIEALAAKKAAGAAMLTRMPVGYGLQKLSDTNTIDQLNKIIQEAAQNKRGPNGKTQGR